MERQRSAEGANDMGKRAFEASNYQDAWIFFREAAMVNPANPKYFSNLAGECPAPPRSAPDSLRSGELEAISARSCKDGRLGDYADVTFGTC